MNRPLRKKPPPKQETPFKDPTPCTDEMLREWRHLCNTGKQLNTNARSLEPLLNRLDAAEKALEFANSTCVGDIDLFQFPPWSDFDDLHEKWRASKGEPLT